MRRKLGGLAVSFALIGTPAVHAQQQILFFASIVDRSGKPVSGLTLDDFKVTENGDEGKVLKVEPIDWPVRVSILIDNGAGMTQSLGQIRNGVKGLLEALPDGIETSLVTLAPQPRFIRRAITDRQALLEGVDRVSPDSSGARFTDALNEAAARLEKEKGNYFPVVIIVGSTTADGSSPPRQRDVQQMLDRFSQRAATVHVVMVSTGARSGNSSFLGGANQINVGIPVAKATGGRYEQIAATTRLETLLPELGAQVARSHALQSRQYRITAQRPAGASGPLADFGLATRPGMALVLTEDGHMP